jgi:hypothetical protein
VHVLGLRRGQGDVKRGTIRMFGMSYGKTMRWRSRAARRLRSGNPGLGSGVGLRRTCPGHRLHQPQALHVRCQLDSGTDDLTGVRVRDQPWVTMSDADGPVAQRSEQGKLGISA